MKRRDVIEKIRAEADELFKLKEKTEVNCEGDVRCMVEKALAIAELGRRRDKILYELAFNYTGPVSIEEKDVIEEIVRAFQVFGVTEEKWIKAVADASRYRRRLDGLVARRVGEINNEGGGFV